MSLIQYFCSEPLNNGISIKVFFNLEFKIWISFIRSTQGNTLRNRNYYLSRWDMEFHRLYIRTKGSRMTCSRSCVTFSGWRRHVQVLLIQAETRWWNVLTECSPICWQTTELSGSRTNSFRSSFGLQLLTSLQHEIFSLSGIARPSTSPAPGFVPSSCWAGRIEREWTVAACKERFRTHSSALEKSSAGAQPSLQQFGLDNYWYWMPECCGEDNSSALQEEMDRALPCSQMG